MRRRAAAIILERKFLILLPLLIIVPLTAALTLWPKPRKWESVAVVWVDQLRPDYAAAELGWTPAGNQVTLLNSFVHANSFSRGVLQQTRLAPTLRDPKQAEVSLKYFWESVSLESADPNFMTIRVRMSDPDLAWKTAQAILDDYQTLLTDRGETTTNAALSDSGGELKQAQQALIDAHTQLSDYLSIHPELTVSGGGTNALAAARDTRLSLLQQQVTDAQSAYAGARQRYLDIQQLGKSARQVQPLSFSIVDQPERPVLPVRERLLVRLQLPAAGLVLGLILSGAVAALFVLTDQTVRDRHDAEAAFGLAILAELPELEVDTGRRKSPAGNPIRRALFARGR